MMRKIVDAWWFTAPAPGNLGDILTPIILDKVFDCDCNSIGSNMDDISRATKPFLISVGSTISLGNELTAFWGTGIAGVDRKPHPKSRYLSVRGPRTRDLVKKNAGIDVPEIYGDPALLMPEAFTEEVEKTFQYGLVPHIHDVVAVSQFYKDNPDVTVISPLNADPFAVIRQMLACEKILSSSLHGLIVSHAYGIPAAWVEHSNKVNGDGTKFHDYYESVGLECIPAAFRETLPVSELSKFRFQHDIQIDMNPAKAALQEYLDEL